MSENDRLLGMEIRKLSNCMRHAVPRFCNDEDVTAVNGRIIMYLYHHKEEDIFQKDIENEFSIRRSTSSSIISLMEKKGYIERVSVAHDARLKKLVLTDKALQVCDIIKTNTMEFEKTLIEGITDEELKIFYSVLDKIVDNINNIQNKE